MTNNSGKIKAISISKKKGIPKTNIPNCMLVANHGMDGDIHAGDWHRQISLLAMESIEKMQRAGLPALRPGAFAENLTTEFIDIPSMEIGTRILIGDSAELEITQIGKECHSKCAIFTIVGDCVMPREGIFAKVIASGEIKLDDEVRIVQISESTSKL